MCHAGCGVIAGCDTDESLAAATDGIHPDYLSPSLQSVASTMRKLIDTRAELAKYRSAPTVGYRYEFSNGGAVVGQYRIDAGQWPVDDKPTAIHELIIRPEAP